MTGPIPLHIGARPGPLGGVRPTWLAAASAFLPLAVYLGGAALFGNALRSSFTDGLVLRAEAALLAGVPALLAIALLERRAGRDGLASVGLREPFAGSLLRGLGLYAVAFPLLALASMLVPKGSPPADEPLFFEFLYPTNSVGLRLFFWAVGISAFVVGIPLLEEVLFRGWLQGIVGARVGPWVAIPAGAGIWTLGHAPADRPAILLLGLLLGFLYRRTGRLGACVGVHALHNALALFFVPAPGWFEWTGA
ncbi:MAG: CPBP family intramembrane metalloprotease [Planctomycetes bacterium]|nr:CPBP family intramembrane metalloprotease [Planctomycetota bacterium]